ncbi:hypothetical protein PPACK8108_LOCUS13451 [Phakopsora pachyrhizi]|uniref:Uncharacterized protein n=1 Tax=Phakopsora pachyrhizi TaxID=170000 RepID=A0AAV0B343_PHAPC|nr:hypothetical protein PPACK8108_LOCUS13451 [Phakopsora pachyrhizi]
MTYKSNKTFPWLGHSTTGLQVATQGGKSLGFIISMPITRHRSCSHNLTLIRFPYLSKDLGVSAAELGSKTDFPVSVSVSVSLLELLINVFGISLTSLTLNNLRKRGQGVEDERTSPTDASVDLQRVIWILTATPQTVIHNQESLIDPTRIRMLLRLVTNSHKPEAKKLFIAPQSDACKDQVSTTLVKRLRSQNTASKVPDQQVNEEASEDQRLVSSRARKPSFFAQQRSCNGLMIELDDQPICQEQIKIDKRRKNTKDVQEHTCPVETIGQTMLNVSQNQSHFECPIVQELTKPVVVDVALLNHVDSQNKGWTECPLVSESH